MPTLHKPTINHVGFDWESQPRKFADALALLQEKILYEANFFGEYDNNWGENSEACRLALIDEICGLLCLAAAIEQDGGFKAPGKLIATLHEIKRNPDASQLQYVEPEALGVLGSNYRRETEPPGTYWFDLDFPIEFTPTSQNIKRAAELGIVELKKISVKGRPKRLITDVLAKRLLSLFCRFNEKATRHSVLTEHNRLMEDGPFFRFVETCLTPLNDYFRSAPFDHRPPQVSPAEVARRATEIINRK